MMANRSRSHYLDIGVLGEDLVTQWLRSTGWVILERRWHCRWGEIDVVARFEPFKQQSALTNIQGVLSNSLPLLAFVEVKTRSRGNWDAGGLLSITPQKQAKLWQTARCFLATHPSMAEHQCRFDVALVYYQLAAKPDLKSSEKPVSVRSLPVQLGQIVSIAEYQLLLQDYIPSAFDQEP
jgi:putative endonuclease